MRHDGSCGPYGKHRELASNCVSRTVVENFPASICGHLRRCLSRGLPFEQAWSEALARYTPREMGWGESCPASKGQPKDSSPKEFLKRRVEIEYNDPENIENRPYYDLEGLL